ncbi:MAG: YceI family protein [Isosphaeraceae bacterium]
MFAPKCQAAGLSFRAMALGLLVSAPFSGCANPADDAFKAAATAPRDTETKPAAREIGEGSPRMLEITTSGSKVEFVGSKVTGNHAGGFKMFSGFAALSEDLKSLETVSVTIDMKSTWSDNDKLTEHLKNADFFDVTKFPESTFRSTEIKAGGEKGASHTLTGNLTLHGVTKSISVPATITLSDQGAKLASEFAINRKDFGISYPGKADDLIRDDVLIKLELTANKP